MSAVTERGGGARETFGAPGIRQDGVAIPAPLVDGIRVVLLPVARWLLFTSGLHDPKPQGTPACIYLNGTKL